MDRYIKGEVINRNVASNMRKARIYVCPICGNVIQSAGDAAVSCCGVSLPAQEPDEPDEDHHIRVETTEGELYVKVDHS